METGTPQPPKPVRRWYQFSLLSLLMAQITLALVIYLNMPPEYGSGALQFEDGFYRGGGGIWFGFPFKIFWHRPWNNVSHYEIAHHEYLAAQILCNLLLIGAALVSGEFIVSFRQHGWRNVVGGIWQRRPSWQATVVAFEFAFLFVLVHWPDKEWVGFPDRFMYQDEWPFIHGWRYLAVNVYAWTAAAGIFIAIYECFARRKFSVFSFASSQTILLVLILGNLSGATGIAYGFPFAIFRASESSVYFWGWDALVAQVIANASLIVLLTIVAEAVCAPAEFVKKLPKVHRLSVLVGILVTASYVAVRTSLSKWPFDSIFVQRDNWRISSWKSEPGPYELVLLLFGCGAIGVVAMLVCERCLRRLTDGSVTRTGPL
ncbi:MAG TPA: hypothetical protein VEJ63_10810 [Planctomycetota bacterium]|nr:hypothetical protein [Planctomycetota bacterium]